MTHTDLKEIVASGLSEIDRSGFKPPKFFISNTDMPTSICGIPILLGYFFSIDHGGITTKVDIPLAPAWDEYGVDEVIRATRAWLAGIEN